MGFRGAAVAIGPTPVPIPRLIGIVLVAALALTWAYGPIFSHVVLRWSVDPQYSHGFLVPFMAAGILWLRRDRLAGIPLSPSWGALALLAIFPAARLSGYVVDAAPRPADPG